MDKRFTAAHLAGHKALDGGQRVYTFKATTDAVDRQGDIVTLDGWDFSQYEGNPVILDSHNYNGIENIVGRAVPPLRLVDGAWEVDVLFSDTPKGQLAQKLVDEGSLRAVSVGFQPKAIARATERNQPDRITEKQLLEISVVPVPANQEALRVRGLDSPSVAELAAAIAKALAGGKPMPKAADFDTVLAIDEMEADLWEQRWRMNCALDEANQAAADDDTKSPEERLAAIETNYQQHAAKMLDWWKAWIALDVAADPGEDEATKALRLAQKAGRRLSAESMKTIEKAIGHKEAAIGLLKSLIGKTQDDGEPSGGTGADQGDKGAGPTGAKGADPSPDDVTVNADLGALMAFISR